MVRDYEPACVRNSTPIIGGGGSSHWRKIHLRLVLLLERFRASLSFNRYLSQRVARGTS